MFAKSNYKSVGNLEVLPEFGKGLVGLYVWGTTLPFFFFQISRHQHIVIFKTQTHCNFSKVPNIYIYIYIYI